VTSRIARPILEEVVKDLRDLIDLDVFELRSVPIASLATTKLIASELATYGGSGKADLIVIPGLSIGSAREIQNLIGVRAVKGPKYLGDLPEMLKQLLQGLEFSPDVPADEVMREKLTKYYQTRLNEVLQSKKPLFKLRNVVFAETPPPLNLIYEYLVSEYSSVEHLETKLSELRTLSYEGVVIGCGIECRALDLVSKLLSVSSAHDMLTGIDLIYESLPKEKLKDLLDLSDLILNISVSNVDLVASYLRTDQAVVAVPSSTGGEDLIKVIEMLQDMGFNKILVDTIVRPPTLGFVDSIIELSKIRSRVRYPILFSPANVYELIDADTPGVIALLIDIGFELGASSVLITESSVKARGASLEASISRELIYRAFLKKSPPVNQGIDLLIIKDKKDLNIPVPAHEGVVERVSGGEGQPRLDMRYYVKIYVDKGGKQIVVDVHDRSNNKILKRYVGSKALDLGRTLLRDYEINVDHALYIGYELSKAETALRLGKSYVQDEDLFKRTYH
jgi:dihydropteroate synthase-like protein